MPFIYPEEDQDERIIPPGPRGPGMDESMYGANLSRGIPQVGTPVRVQEPGARTALWQTQSQKLPSQPAFGIGQRIVMMGQEQASPLGGAFSLGKVGILPPLQPTTSNPGWHREPRGQQTGIGHRILGLNGEPAANWGAYQPKSVANLKPSGAPREPLVYPNSAGARFNGAPQGQGIFSSFVPAGANAGVDQSRRWAQSRFASRGQGISRATQNSQSSDPQVIPVKRTPSKIQQAEGNDLKPNYKVAGKGDQMRLRSTLGQLTRGLDDPALTPMGIAPDGAPKIDVTYLTKVPSRVFPPAQGDRLIYGDLVKPEFLSKVKQISSELGIDPNWLMAVMAFESKEKFTSDVPNAAGSSGIGLIQFTKKTGYDLKALAKMNPEDQLDYVKKYLQPHTGKVHSLSDLYMAVIWPKAIGKPDDYVMFRSPSDYYRQNQGLDRGGKGYVTKADAIAAVEKVYRRGVARGVTILNPNGSTESRTGGQIIVREPRRPNIIKRN